MVRTAGFEPAHLAALPPQSSVSANSTTCATTSHNEPTRGPGRKTKLVSTAIDSPKCQLPNAGWLLNCHEKNLELRLQCVHVLAQMVRLLPRSRTRSLNN